MSKWNISSTDWKFGKEVFFSNSAIYDLLLFYAEKKITNDTFWCASELVENSRLAELIVLQFVLGKPQKHHPQTLFEFNLSFDGLSGFVVGFGQCDAHPPRTIRYRFVECPRND